MEKTDKELAIEEIMHLALQYVSPHKFFKEDFKLALENTLETATLKEKPDLKKEIFLNELKNDINKFLENKGLNMKVVVIDGNNSSTPD